MLDEVSIPLQGGGGDWVKVLGIVKYVRRNLSILLPDGFIRISAASWKLFWCFPGSLVNMSAGKKLLTHYCSFIGFA